MEQIKFKNIEELQKKDILKIRDKKEFASIEDFYVQESMISSGNKKKLYYYFKGFSVSKDTLCKFFETHENNDKKFCIYGEEE